MTNDRSRDCPETPTTICVVGATSTIAVHCLRRWAEAGAQQFILVGRNEQRLQHVAGDLQVRQPGAHITCHTLDFSNADAITHTVNNICTATPPDLVLIAHGILPDQQQCQTSLESAHAALHINALSPVMFAEAFTHHLEQHNTGALAVISSVAGDRGRRSNYVYGAAKGLVTRYVQGLQHRLAGTGVYVALIKPGPTATPMTEHLQQQGARLANADTVAGQIVAGLRRRQAVIYTPRRWQVIMLIIRHLPRFIFHRMNI